MKIFDQINAFKKASTHPLTVNGQNVLELSKQDPRAAYDLVWKEVERRGGLEAPKRFFARQSCVRQAMAKPLPGAAGDAFTASEMRVNGRRIYEVVPTHFRVLQAVDSPLLKLMAGAIEAGGKEAEQNIEEADEWNICFIFTTPPRQLRAMLREQGVDAIRKAAELLCDGINEVNGWTASEINMTVMAAVAQLKEHVKTTVAFEAEAEATSNSSFFRELREKQSRQPASEKSSAI